MSIVKVHTISIITILFTQSIVFPNAAEKSCCRERTLNVPALYPVDSRQQVLDADDYIHTEVVTSHQMDKSAKSGLVNPFCKTE